MALNFFKRKPKKTCVIGLDGVPCTLLKSMMELGVMPRTREIVSMGRIEPMTVTLPEISSVSWSTFMTGRSPGEHGIFGFTDIKEGTYSLRFPSFSDLKTPTIWDTLGKNSMKSVVINQPSTYPARRIPGVIISGFVAIDLGRSVSPPMHLPFLNDAGYEIDIDTQKCADDLPKLFNDLADLLDKRETAMNYLWDKESWNLMEVVVTGTDRLHHFMFDAYEDESHPHHHDFLGYYGRVDSFIGRVFDKYKTDCPDGSGFFILSDHGFCQTKKEVYINSVLRKEGFLKVGPDDKNLEAVDGATRAFSLDPARIYLNRKGRFHSGGVEAADARAIIKDMADVFSELTIDGEKIIKYTFTGEETYKGPFSSQGPDLLLVPHDGFDLKGKVGSHEYSGDRKLQGMHTWENAFFFSLDPSLLEGANELNIVDVASKITGSLGVEI